jgi:hypothetical protein
MNIPNEILIPEVARLVNEGKSVTLPLRGQSMRPYLEDQRDKGLLVKIEKPLKKGDVILAETAPRRYALHRIVKIEGDDITMYGDGNFSPEHIKRSDVLAIAVGFYRNGSTKLDSVDSLSYRIYWRLWVWLRPLRRYLLIVWRLKHYPKETMEKIINKIKLK